MTKLEKKNKENTIYRVFVGNGVFSFFNLYFFVSMCTHMCTQRSGDSFPELALSPHHVDSMDQVVKIGG